MTDDSAAVESNGGPQSNDGLSSEVATSSAAQSNADANHKASTTQENAGNSHNNNDDEENSLSMDGVQYHPESNGHSAVESTNAMSPEPPATSASSSSSAPPPQAQAQAQAPEQNNPHSNNNNNNKHAHDDVKQEEVTSQAVPSKAQASQPPQETQQSAEVDKVIESLLSLRRNVNRGCLNISCESVEKVCLQTRQIFMSEAALLEIDAPMNIVGDIHGQYFDLLRAFELAGAPDGVNTRYIFLGDYVDRGSHSLEVILLLFCYKIKYRNGFYLLRGNHECGTINRIYGFFDECKRRFSSDGIRLWKTFTDVFNYLPVAAIIDEKIFCMHGGISPQIMKRGSLQQIANIKRPTDVPDRGLLCDLLWADPDRFIDTWGPNDRGVSYTFGAAVLHQFLSIHEIDLICRAHQVVEDGYEFFGARTLVTLFSAPNYCNEFDNAGAIMKVDGSLLCSFSVIKPNSKRKTRFYK